MRRTGVMFMVEEPGPEFAGLSLVQPGVLGSV
jgi:hypothetical protein